jgi:hypothetical protein
MDENARPEVSLPDVSAANAMTARRALPIREAPVDVSRTEEAVPEL